VTRDIAIAEAKWESEIEEGLGLSTEWNGEGAVSSELGPDLHQVTVVPTERHPSLRAAASLGTGARRVSQPTCRYVRRT
jgi:hypothetical protein